ncbi:MAG: aquaporin [Gaiellaceae bacterium]
MEYSTSQRSVAEFIGSFALTFIGAGSVITVGGILGGDPIDLLAIAIAHGLVLGIFVTALGHVSGAHFNPAVTLGVLVTRRISGGMAVAYWIAQFTGGVAAAACLRVVFDDRIADPAGGVSLGAPALGPNTNVGEGFVLEIIMTFFLVFVVFATAIDPKGAFKFVGGFAIGLTIGVDIIVGGPLTGAAMNPQRAFGPQLLSGEWSNGWIYYVAPAIGGVLAALVYHHIFLRGRNDDPA